MVDFSNLAGKLSSASIDNIAGGLNGKASPLNSFVSKVNSTLGTNISQLNPSALLKSAANGQLSSLFGGTQNQNSPVANVGKGYASKNVSTELEQRMDPVTNFEWIAMVVNKSPGAKDELPWYYIDEISVPLPNFGSTQKYVEGKDKKYADMFTINTCTIKVYTDVSGLAFNFCNMWCKSIYRDDNLYQMPLAYKKDIYVFILDPTRKIVVNMQLLGCWPSAWADYQLTSGAAEALGTSLTLSVDDFKMNYDSSPAAVTASINSVVASTSNTASLGIPQIPTSLSAFQNAVQSAQSTIGALQSKVNSVLKF